MTQTVFPSLLLILGFGEKQFLFCNIEGYWTLTSYLIDANPQLSLESG